jgi:hypothetical protein
MVTQTGREALTFGVIKDSGGGSFQMENNIYWEAKNFRILNDDSKYNSKFLFYI